MRICCNVIYKCSNAWLVNRGGMCDKRPWQNHPWLMIAGPFLGKISQYHFQFRTFQHSATEYLNSTGIFYNRQTKQSQTFYHRVVETYLFRRSLKFFFNNFSFKNGPIDVMFPPLIYTFSKSEITGEKKNLSFRQ